MIKLDLEYVGDTPIFSMPVTEEDDRLFRVWGYQQTRAKVIFPAFPPLVYGTLEDLDTVYDEGEFGWTKAALDHIEALRERKAKHDELELPVELEYAYKPYQHQHRTLSDVYYNDRWYMGLDMGLGKSKILIDLLRLLKQLGEPCKVLLAVPPHLVRNWAQQIDIHGCDELTYTCLDNGENDALAPEDRVKLYNGEPLFDFELAGTYHLEHPTLWYEALPAGLSSDVYAAEDAYVEGIVTGDSKARGRARTQLRKLSKKDGFELPTGAWRVIDPVRAPRPCTEVDITIGSYDVLVEDYKQQRIQRLLKTFSVFAADEAHYFKSYRSERSKTFRKIVRSMHRRVLMSGSPTAGDPRHLYASFDILSPILTGGYIKFMRRYVVKSKFQENMVVGFKNLHIMNALRDEVGTWLKLEDCVDLDLPTLNVIDVPVTPTKETRDAYNAVVTDWQVWLPDADEMLEVQYGAERVTKLLQILSGFVVNTGKHAELCTGCPHLFDCVENEIKPYTKHCQVEQVAPKREIVRLKKSPKLAMAVGMVEDILQSPDNKVIIWCSFTEEVAMLSAAFHKKRWKHAIVQGSTKNAHSQRETFENDPDCQIYISNVAISEGFTLNTANYTMYYGAVFNLTHYEQSMKRNYRIGQGRPVTVYRLYVEGSIHEEVFRALDTRRDVAAAIGDVIRCDGCPQRSKCKAAGTLPFDPDCVYDKSVAKKSIKPQRL